MSETTSVRDKAAIGLIVIGAAVIVVCAAARPAVFGATTKSHPFLMGFVKLFLLGTFGERDGMNTIMEALLTDKFFMTAANALLISALPNDILRLNKLISGGPESFIALAVIGWIAASILVNMVDRQGIHDRFANQTFVTRRVRS